MSGNNEEVRINKYIASSGLCSRREADRLIEEGKVTINGVTAEPGAKVMSSDTVSVMGKTVIPEESMLYIALNKPLGITCTTDTRDPSNIIDFLGFDERIFPIGRLDKNSSGLILLTNDGSVVNKLLRAENG
ncbi:MAG: pseudouridine synthase, partial [Saccharofermentans sp.]|nr:pseudouridine synthase [Saccharofermentans sp.]